jgi:hypothetical protein
VAADVACSSGDLPVVTVEATLAAVAGLATAAVVAAVPAVVAAVPALPADAVPALPSIASGAAHPFKSRAVIRRLSSLNARNHSR